MGKISYTPEPKTGTWALARFVAENLEYVGGKKSEWVQNQWLNGSHNGKTNKERLHKWVVEYLDKNNIKLQAGVTIQIENDLDAYRKSVSVQVKEDTVTNLARKKQDPTIAASSAPKIKMKKSDPAKKIIVIDPGHGGAWAKTIERHGDPGTCRYLNKNLVREADIVLKIAKKLQPILEKRKYIVHLTRTTDELPLPKGFKAATKDAKKKKSLYYRGLIYPEASLFISIHLNSAGISKHLLKRYGGDPDKVPEKEVLKDFPDIASGAQVYYQHDNKPTKTLSNHLISGLKSNKITISNNSQIKKQLAVLDFAEETPGVLVECAFLNNSKDIKIIITESFQENVAKGIADGIDNYFKKK